MTLEKDSIFKKQLDLGYKFQKYVRDKFIEAGFRACVPKKKVRPDRSRIDEFSDEFDVLVFVKNLKNAIIFETKYLRRDFTCIEDFPFTRPFCDRVGTWERKSKKNKPHGIIIGSQFTNAMFLIPVSSEIHWTIKRNVEDKSRSTPEEKYIHDYYEVEKKYCRSWEWLIERLREMEGS